MTKISYLRAFEGIDHENRRKNLNCEIRSVSPLEHRHILVQMYSWAIPDENILNKISKAVNKHTDGKLVEIGAGSGYWSYLLKQQGLDVISYDKYPPGSKKNEYKFTRKWFNILPGGPRKLTKHPDRTLFLCWPSMSDSSLRCLNHFKGKFLIYVGEDYGGCNANDEFFQKLREEWSLVKELEIPKWGCINDKAYFFKKSLFLIK